MSDLRRYLEEVEFEQQMAKRRVSEMSLTSVVLLDRLTLGMRVVQQYEGHCRLLSSLILDASEAFVDQVALQWKGSVYEPNLRHLYGSWLK